MEILYSDNNWLFTNKPTGISTHGAWEGDLALQEWWKLYHLENLFVCSRLDKDTSGVIVFAKTKAASEQAQRIHENETSEKEYYFLSHRNYLEEKLPNTWINSNNIGDKTATTKFFYLDKIGNNFLYKAVINRGRTHQIRIHASQNGIPILGDTEYGGAKYPRLCLHCHKVSWPGVNNHIEAPLPDIFNLSSNYTLTEAYAACDKRLQFYTGITDCFRIIHRGEISSIDCIVDCYGKYLCMWVFSPETKEGGQPNKIKQLLEFLLSKYKANGAVIKYINQNPHKNKLISNLAHLGELPPPTFVVSEHGLNYSVSLTQSQHNGLFLDQRDNRKRVLQAAEGKKVANLFSYTCSFSVAAAAGKAEVVFSVDLAKPYLKIGMENFALNKLAGGQGKFVEEDALKWLQRQEKKCTADANYKQFDLLICDPPTFSSVKKGNNFSVAEDWTFLVEKVKNITSPNAQVIFCNNHRSGNVKLYQKILQEHFQTVNYLSPPLDFPQCTKEVSHVNMFYCHK